MSLKKPFGYFLLLICLNLAYCGLAQENDSLPKGNHLTLKQKLIVSGLTMHQVASLYIEYKWWWKGNYHHFYALNDGDINNYSLGIDKLGHFYASYFYFTALNELMRYGGFSSRARLSTSIILPAVWALSIELGDGFSTYAFSYNDLIANGLGIGYGILQEEVPFMRNFNFKFSYIPSAKYIDNRFDKWALSEDYDGHIYWLTANVHGLLPSKAKNWWPEFLNVAFGYGVNHFPDQPNMQREFFIGLDYNLSCIKTRKNALRSGLLIIDKFHFPAPGYKKTGEDSFEPHWFLLN